ncbi:MAG: hypothetical protein HY983_01165, partial [Candidatus Magasanikbacteria bacterium]|nr:hypothetical protein [Candidatus Magasanikbacteria bacterium]
RAVYDKRKNETYLTGQDVTSGRVRAKYKGLLLLKILTNQGRLGYKF